MQRLSVLISPYYPGLQSYRSTDRSCSKTRQLGYESHRHLNHGVLTCNVSCGTYISLRFLLPDIDLSETLDPLQHAVLQLPEPSQPLQSPHGKTKF